MKEEGRKGFSKKYWDENYSDLDTMDGVANAKDHARYIKHTFAYEFVDISTIIDFGAGLGHMFQAVLKEFKPYKTIAIEPSDYAFERLSKKKLKSVDSTKVNLYQEDILKFCESRLSKLNTLDLGLCTSVFQYLQEDEIDKILPILSEKIRYLYFTVPTDVELKRQREELEFCDEYAYSRSKDWYFKKLSPHFTFISARLLESKVHFNEENTLFTDLLFRF